MPERPDLEYIVPVVKDALVERCIVSVHPGNPVVQRLTVPGGVEVLQGARVQDVTRRSNTVCVHLSGDVDLVVAPMLAGRFQLATPARKRTQDTVLALDLDDDTTLWVRDKVNMSRIVTLPSRQWEKTPGLPKVGVDVLSPTFTVSVLKALTKRQRNQVKLFLLDKALFDSFGNAYADETLFAAGIHPKTRVNELDDDALTQLHRAIVDTLQTATDHIAAAQPRLQDKLRDFLKVRNRKGEPCPVCSTPIRAAGVRGYDAFFCPTCQPDVKGRGFVDWRNTR